MRSKVIRGVASIVLTFTMGCSQYVPVQSAPRRESRMRIRFSEPRTLMVSRTLGDSIAISGLRQVTGSLVEIRGDTVVLSIWAMEAAHGLEMTPPLGARAAIPRDAGTEISHLEINKARTATFLSVIVLIPAVLLFMIGHALANEST